MSFRLYKIDVKVLLITAAIFGVVSNGLGSTKHQQYSAILSFEDSTELSNVKLKNRIEFFDYLLDDIFITAGINRGGIFWSNHYQDLIDGNGFNFGIETYTPVSNKVFFNYGLNFAQRSFSHRINYENEATDISFINNFIEIPLYFSFELPVFREFDFRFNLGAQLAFRLSTKQNNNYPESYLQAENTFSYNKNEFASFDGGMNFGLSAEYNGFYLRLRNASGNKSIYRNEQGMLHAFYIDFGYFFLRKIREVREE